MHTRGNCIADATGAMLSRKGDWAPSSGRARSFRPGRSETLALLARSLGHGEPGLLPRREAAVHLEDGLEPHLLGDVCGEGGTPGAVAVEDEALARSEDLLVVRAVGIDPELEHAARAVEGAGDHAFPLQLPHVAQVHERHVVAAMRLLETEGGDAGLRLVHELPESLLELHDVLPSDRALRTLHRVCSPRSGMPLLSRSLRLGLERLDGDDNGARRTRAPLSRPVPRSRRRRWRRAAGGFQADRVIGVYFLRFRRKPMPPTRAAPDARSVSVAGSGTRTCGVAWALPGSMKRTASAIRVINSR